METIRKIVFSCGITLFAGYLFCEYAFAKSFVLPEKLTFAGQTVPLERQVVREHFDALYTSMCYNNPGQSRLWLRREQRILPTIRKIIVNAGLPEDFVYLVVAESDMLPRALSPAGAYSYWQFMPGTGKDEGLDTHLALDERGDLVKATLAACNHLKELYQAFGKDWFLAMAAYNNGRKNVETMLKAQHAKTYWDAWSNNETATYVPRIILIKTLFENPALFGIEPGEIVPYPEFSVDRISFTLPESVMFATVCDWAETDYRTMLTLNPQIYRTSYLKDVTLPKNIAMHVDVPKSKVNGFLKRLDDFIKLNKAQKK
ncbi:MAG: lytic transglycosylase domain-containing protein [bacterium]|nr:lytic transglycosylase domain-containing protein [bacterium]